ncbi:MAG: hypothetical protein ACRDH0_06720 [Actinomycetota bacterium]
MADLHDLLERATDHAPEPGFTFLELGRRRDRRHRAKRIEAATIGLVVAMLVLGGTLFALRERATTRPGSGGVEGTSTSINLPPATQAPLVVGSGQYDYRRVHLVGGCPAGQEHYCGGYDVELAASLWWSSEDSSGRIAADAVRNYGIDEGKFGPGEFPNPNGIDVSGFPTGTQELSDFLLARSQPDGESPAPLVTPPPNGAPQDGRMWRAITDLLEDPHVTPTVRAALLDVAAGLQGARVTTDGVDPVGRPAIVISFGNWGGELIERLFVDPVNHELLAMTTTSEISDEPFRYYVVEVAGVARSLQSVPETSSIPAPLRDVPRTPTSGKLQPSPVAVGSS